MTRAPEKAAPIPLDVENLASTFAYGWRRVGDDSELARLLVAAIMRDRADRASQEERIREDALNTLLQSANENSRALGDEFWGRVAYWLLQLKIDRARLRGDAS